MREDTMTKDFETEVRGRKGIRNLNLKGNGLRIEGYVHK